jgi:hypothetical protein
MILAVVIFLGPTGPVGSMAAREVFPTMEACHNFSLTSSPVLDIQRMQLELTLGQPIAYVTLCHNMGSPT